MTITIPAAYVDTFESNVIHLAQQKTSYFRDHVEELNKQSEHHNWDRLGTSAASVKSTARTASPTSDLAWTRRQTLTATYHVGETVEPEDVAQMLIEPKSAVARSLAMGMYREVDDVIITALGGAALDGDGSSVAYTAGQKIGGGTTIISIDTILEADEKFNSNDVDPDESKVWAYGPTQKRKLMQLLEITSKDFQPDPSKGLGTGALPNTMGFLWVMSNRLNVPSTGEIDNMAWCKEAMGLHVSNDIWARVAERPDLSFAWQFYCAMSIACVRVQDEKVVKVHLKDALS